MRAVSILAMTSGISQFLQFTLPLRIVDGAQVSDRPFMRRHFRGPFYSTPTALPHASKHPDLGCHAARQQNFSVLDISYCL
jgi:hypothetical protein